jgi:hypothetical protein
MSAYDTDELKFKAVKFDPNYVDPEKIEFEKRQNLRGKRKNESKVEIKLLNPMWPLKRNQKPQYLMQHQMSQLMPLLTQQPTPQPTPQLRNQFQKSLWIRIKLWLM